MSNILFAQAAVENLPAELDGTASEVLVQFPWGSLLHGVAGDADVMSQMRRLCVANAQLRVTIGWDLERDKAEWARLGLEPISIDYVKTVLDARYRTAGFRIVETQELSAAELNRLRTSWTRRLDQRPNRSFLRIIAVAESRNDGSG